jgi:hypothetical protein
LDDFVLQRGHRERSLFAIGLWNIHPARGQSPVRSPVDTAVQISEVSVKVCGIVRPRHAIDARGRIPLESVERLAEQFDGDVVQERGEFLRLSFSGCCPYTVEPR